MPRKIAWRGATKKCSPDRALPESLHSSPTARSGCAVRASRNSQSRDCNRLTLALGHSTSPAFPFSERLRPSLRGHHDLAQRSAKTSHNMHAPKNHEKTNASIPQLRSGLRKSSIRALVPKLKVTMAPQPCTNQHLGHRTASRRRP